MNYKDADSRHYPLLLFVVSVLAMGGWLVFPPSVAAGEIVASLGETIVYPIIGPRLSSKYGSRHHPVYKVTRHHNGVDLAAPKDALIRAIGDGVVVFADPYSGYGNLVVVQHEGGITSHYGHCSKIHVSPGARVTAGEIIATVGRTGLATGHHLHFEIRRQGEPLDPEQIFPGLAARGEG